MERWVRELTSAVMACGEATSHLFTVRVGVCVRASGTGAGEAQRRGREWGAEGGEGGAGAGERAGSALSSTLCYGFSSRARAWAGEGAGMGLGGGVQSESTRGCGEGGRVVSPEIVMLKQRGVPCRVCFPLELYLASALAEMALDCFW